MTIPRVVRGAARALSKESDYESSVMPDEARAETVDAIKQALRDRAASRRRRRFIVPAIAAVAIAASVALVASNVSRKDPVMPATAVNAPKAAASPTADNVDGTVSVVSSAGATSALAKGSSVHAGDRIVSTEGRASITLPSGSRVELERATDLRVDIASGAQIIELADGAVTSRVTKVAPDDRFVVRSADVEVEVRGTVFRVERANGGACATRTKVNVVEGRVVVRARGAENVLGPGDTWESTCSEAVAVPSARPAPIAPIAPSAPRVPPSTASDLSAQNAMFGEAMAAKSRGETASAVAQLDAFVQKYPNSPLHEAAAVQRMRLLSSSGDARAAVVAKDYLTRYPNGFAHAEAERLAAQK